MEVWNDECLLCSKRVQEFMQVEDAKRKVENLLDMLGVTPSCLDDLWTTYSDSWNLEVCKECQLLIAHGIDLKKELDSVRADLIEFVVGSEKNLEDDLETKYLPIPELFSFRTNLRKIVVDSGGEKVKTKDNPQDWSAVLKTEDVETHESDNESSLPLNMQLSPLSPADILASGPSASEMDTECTEIASAQRCVNVPDCHSEILNQQEPQLVLRQVHQSESVPLLSRDQQLHLLKKLAKLQPSQEREGRPLTPMRILGPYKLVKRGLKATPVSTAVKHLNSSEETMHNDDATTPPLPKKSRNSVGPGCQKIQPNRVISVSKNQKDPRQEASAPSFKKKIVKNSANRVKNKYKKAAVKSTLFQKKCIKNISTAKSSQRKAAEKKHEEAAVNFSHSPRYRPKLLSMRMALIKSKYLSVTNVKFCSMCPTMCSSEAILAIHNEEIHGDKDCGNLRFNCPQCNGLVLPNNFLSDSALPYKRYAIRIGKNSQQKVFSKFFQLCDYHYMDCLHPTLNSKGEKYVCRQIVYPYLTNVREYQSLSIEIPDAIKITQINYYGPCEPVRPCILCLDFHTVESKGMKQHYRRVHGLETCCDSVFSCNKCNEIYTPKKPGIEISQLEINDQFKEFALQHLSCEGVEHPLMTWTCLHCPEPKKVFTTQKSLLIHQTQNHSTEGKYKCDVCGDRTHDCNGLIDHARQHHRAKVRWHCGVCAESFLDHRNYAEHITSSHEKTASFVICFICSHKERTLFKLRSHMELEHGQKKIGRPPSRHQELPITQAHTSKPKKRIRTPTIPVYVTGKPINCFICDLTFHTAQLLDLHLREVHDTNTSDDLRFICKCTNDINQAKYLVQDNGSSNKEYRYPPVVNAIGKEQQQSTFAEYCNAHILTCSNWLEEEVRAGKSTDYKCGKCHQDSTCLQDYIKHLQNHYSHALKTCALCEIPVNDPVKMRSHMFRAHYLKIRGNTQYFCRFCHTCYVPEGADIETGRLVPNELKNFKEFVAEHVSCKEKKPLERKTSFDCKFCQKSLRSPELLFTHEIEEHTKKYPVFCDQCGLGCASINVLNSHMRNIHRGKCFKCHICPESFSKRSSLNVHLRIHTNERPYMCFKCGKGFRSSCKLRRHETTHREIADMPCPTCGKLYRSIHDVRNHIYQVHKIQRKHGSKKHRQ